MALTEERLRAILAWVVIVLVGGPVAGAVLLGVVGGDSVSPPLPASGNFADKNVGTGKAVTVVVPLTGSEAQAARPARNARRVRGAIMAQV